MSSARQWHARHPNNAIGDFYVEDRCCTLCGVPETAPALFEIDYERQRHCWVKRQPTNVAELDEMLDVIASAELSASATAVATSTSSRGSKR